MWKERNKTLMYFYHWLRTALSCFFKCAYLRTMDVAELAGLSLTFFILSVVSLLFAFAFQFVPLGHHYFVCDSLCCVRQSKLRTSWVMELLEQFMRTIISQLVSVLCAFFLGLPETINLMRSWSRVGLHWIKQNSSFRDEVRRQKGKIRKGNDRWTDIFIMSL